MEVVTYFKVANMCKRSDVTVPDAVVLSFKEPDLKKQFSLRSMEDFLLGFTKPIQKIDERQVGSVGCFHRPKILTICCFKKKEKKKRQTLHRSNMENSFEVPKRK